MPPDQRSTTEPSPPSRGTTTPFWTAPTDPPPDRRRRGLVTGGVVAAALLVGVAAFAGVSGASSGTSGYRTATVSSQEVDRTLSGVGTIEPVDQASVAFPVSGTVATVDVTAGQVVDAGEVLATLDAADLETSLHEAEATLAEAELTLEKVLNGESTGTSGGGGVDLPSGSTSGSTGSTSSSSSASVPSSPSTGGTTDQAALVAARQEVAAAQHTLDVDLAAAQAALDASTTACATSSGGTTTTTTTSTTSTTAAEEGGGSDTQACLDALAASLAAQQVVAADEAALNQAIAAYEALVSSSAGSGGGSVPSTSGSSPSSSATGSPSTGSSSGSTTVSSADIVAAQKAVDAAQAGVTVAQQAVAQGTIVSPIAGTVTSVTIAVGDSITAGSSTDVIRVAGSGGYQITTSVAVTDLPHVEVGQEASVVPDGSTTVLTGTVVRIGLVASSSSGSTTTYPVVVSLTDPDADLPDGGLASVGIVTGAVTASTAVPTSAVTSTDTGHTVVLIDGGSPTTVDVEVGTVGSTWTEINSGVEVGDTVVLADLSEPLPGSATSSSSSSSSTGGTGGFSPPAGFSPPGS